MPNRCTGILRNFGITYGAPDIVVTQASLDGFNFPLFTYVDASLGNEHTKGKSPTGSLRFTHNVVFTSTITPDSIVDRATSVTCGSIDYGVGDDGHVNWYSAHGVREKCIC